jgi:UDP-3-O-[3-hydroxymyristoyl] glucosamine N-acyltransferase
MKAPSAVREIQIPEFVKLPSGIDRDLIDEISRVHFEETFCFDGIGDVHSRHKDCLLTFLSENTWTTSMNSNDRIGGVFCRPADVSNIRNDIVRLVVDDPKFYFFTLMDGLARRFHEPFPTRIGSGCQIAKAANISPASVIIGDNVTIEPGAYVAAGSIIEDRVLIRANATLGVDGFQHQRTSRGMISPLHDGWLIVESGVEIGYCASVSRGFSYRPTRIRAEVKIDSHAYVAHGATIGEQTIVCTHVCVMGHVSVGRSCWLGPSSVITSRVSLGDGAQISLGAVVTTDIPAGARYTGNFAIPHDLFISHLKGGAAS